MGVTMRFLTTGAMESENFEFEEWPARSLGDGARHGLALGPLDSGKRAS